MKLQKQVLYAETFTSCNVVYINTRDSNVDQIKEKFH